MNEKKKPDAIVLIAENRKARHDYDISETIECGLELRGAEVKSLRDKKVHFSNAFAIVNHGELWLVGMKLDRFYAASTHETFDVERRRRLLASKKEIAWLEKLIDQKELSVVPLKLYFKGPWAKVLMGIGKGKTYGDKRETLKRREADRDMERAMRSRR